VQTECVTVLNATAVAGDGDANLAARLHRVLLGLEGRYFDPVRRGVDYRAFAGSDDFRALCALAAGLARFPLATLKEPPERLAFWLNVYNALYLHGVIERRIRATIHEVAAFSATTGYVIDGHLYTARDIEYGVLRLNRPSVAYPGPVFGPSDPRLAQAMPVLDPRIHFGLVCGSRSCPPIRVYSPANVDGELELVSRSYLNQEVEALPERGAVILPMIFYWFPMDFEEGQTTAAFLLRYLEDPGVRDAVAKLDTAEILFRRWNYGLNQT
jgi:hypothetical protein